MSTVEMNDILAGLADDKWDQADGAVRLPFFRVGAYLARPIGLYMGPGFKGARFQVDFEILESRKTFPDDIPLPAGVQCCWMQKFVGDQALVAPNNIKNFLMAVTGHSPAELTKNFVNTVIVSKGTPAMPLSGTGREFGELMKHMGVVVGVNCRHDTSKSQKAITPSSFAMVPGKTLKALGEARRAA